MIKKLIGLTLLIIVTISCMVFAKYIITKNFTTKIGTMPFYFEVDIEPQEIHFINGKAEVNLTLKNNDGTNYNLSNLIYEISFENNDKFDILINDNAVSNNKYTNNIIGNELKNDNIKITFIAKNNVKLEFIENVKLNILTQSPYKKEINLSAKILQVGTTWDFESKKEIQNYRVLTDGRYKLEVWGAQGGTTEGYSTAGVYASYRGGYGSYSVGEVALSENQEMFVVVGTQGEVGLPTETRYGGYNGGGTVYPWVNDPNNNHTNRWVAGGGGATHIALSSGLLKELKDNKEDVLIVAGGGRWSILA